MRILSAVLLVACSGSSSPSAEPLVADVAVGVHAAMESLLRVSWTQSAPLETWLEYRVDEDWLSSPPTRREAGEAEELVLGAPFDTPVDVRVVWADGVEELGSTTTGPGPAGLPIVVEVSGDPDAWDPEMGWVLLSARGGIETSVDGTWTFITDRAGRVVWAKSADTRRANLQPQLSLDGTQILIDQNSFWSVFDGGVDATVDRVDLTGTVLETIPTPRAHHPFAEYPDGSIVWGALTPNQSDEKIKRWESGDEPTVLQGSPAALQRRNLTVSWRRRSGPPQTGKLDPRRKPWARLQDTQGHSTEALHAERFAPRSTSLDDPRDQRRLFERPGSGVRPPRHRASVYRGWEPTPRRRCPLPRRPCRAPEGVDHPERRKQGEGG